MLIIDTDCFPTYNTSILTHEMVNFYSTLYILISFKCELVKINSTKRTKYIQKIILNV
jgi:hypothetical protein